MSGRRICGALGAAIVLAGIAGCGSSGEHAPDLSKLPLVPGTKIELQQKVCDSGSAPYCALQLVVSNSRYHNADELFDAEHRLLLARKWSGADGEGYDHAADAPGHKLRLTYATPLEELDGIYVLGVRRTHQIALQLSSAVYDKTPALSMMLELGAS
jgi:hypothetical protein